MKPYLSQLRTELQLTMRNGEQLLLTLGIPVLLLVFFSLVDVLPTETDDPVDFLAPGILALAVMSTAMVSLGIGTGFERSYHVLKRLGTTPLGRPRLIAAKITSVVVVELVQFAVLIPVAYALGWSPGSPNWLAAVGGVVVGTLAFAGIGLTLAGRLRGEINLAAQNGLYLVLLLLGGMIIPFGKLPGGLRHLAHALPSGALADVLRDALAGAGTDPGLSWAVLAAWAVVAPALAARLFRWDA
ncbi:MAG: ABC transporter permease [Ilumatobacteraceae bacterium]|nr:ABC transporter permease [Ilumatobacter sp.]MCB0984174.1 ABC transporter permease [Ilumatobacter sp.]